MQDFRENIFLISSTYLLYGMDSITNILRYFLVFGWLSLHIVVLSTYKFLHFFIHSSEQSELVGGKHILLSLLHFSLISIWFISHGVRSEYLKGQIHFIIIIFYFWFRFLSIIFIHSHSIFKYSSSKFYCLIIICLVI